MKKGLIIFGIGKIAEVVYYFAKEECNFDVVAFCVDKEYIQANTFKGLPLVPFEQVKEYYPPERYDVFVAVGYQDLNRLREKKCIEAINKGYQLVNVISSGIPRDLKFGWNCFIMPPAIIHPCIKIGNNVFIWSGAMVGHHSIINDHCWLTSCCNVSGNVQIGANTFLAVNATIGHSVRIGKNCFLGANTLVTKDLEDEKVVIEESSKPIRLNSAQFLRMSNFSSL